MIVQLKGNGNTSFNARTRLIYKNPAFIDDPNWFRTWGQNRNLPDSRWSGNGGRQLGRVRSGNSNWFNDDFGKSIAISERGEKIIIGGPWYEDVSNKNGYITVHTPNSIYTTENDSTTASNYTFTNQEKALFPVQQDNAPRGYLYDDRVGYTDSTNFGILRNYEFIYMFNKF